MAMELVQAIFLTPIYGTSETLRHEPMVSIIPYQ